MNINTLKREKKKMVFNFFNTIKGKDVKNMLDLLDGKCTVIESFSIETRLDGKDNLESFF
jgi:hypothetical protein